MAAQAAEEACGALGGSPDTHVRPEEKEKSITAFCSRISSVLAAGLQPEKKLTVDMGLLQFVAYKKPADPPVNARGKKRRHAKKIIVRKFYDSFTEDFKNDATIRVTSFLILYVFENVRDEPIFRTGVHDGRYTLLLFVVLFKSYLFVCDRLQLFVPFLKKISQSVMMIFQPSCRLTNRRVRVRWII